MGSFAHATVGGGGGIIVPTTVGVTAAAGPGGGGAATSGSKPGIRGLRTSTFQLNVSAFCGIGGALRDCLGVVFAGVEEVSGGVGGFKGCVSCQMRLRLS